MNGQLAIFAGSLAGVAFLVFMAVMLRLGASPVIGSGDEARLLAEDAVCGFEARNIGIDAGGRGALLADGEGRILLLAPHGAHFAARLLEPGSTVTREGGRLRVRSADRTFPAVALDLGDAAGPWVERIQALDS